MLQNFWHRASTRWSKEEKKQAEELYNSIGVKNNNLILEFREEADRLSRMEFLNHRVKEVRNEKIFCQKQFGSFKSLYGSNSNENDQLVNDEKNNFSCKNIIKEISDTTRIQKTVDGISKLNWIKWNVQV